MVYYYIKEGKETRDRHKGKETGIQGLREREEIILKVTKKCGSRGSSRKLSL